MLRKGSAIFARRLLLSIGVLGERSEGLDGLGQLRCLECCGLASLTDSLDAMSFLENVVGGQRGLDDGIRGATVMLEQIEVCKVR